jgi:hypothetical protein
MIVATLFNSNDPRFGGYYCAPIRDLVFGTELLQSSNRPLRIAHGDVLIYGKSETTSDYRRIAEATYFAGTWNTIQAERLRETYLKQTIWSWVIHNATRTLATGLDETLRSDVAYLGLLEVDLALSHHLVFFRNLMPQWCRVQGKECTLFYSMGNEDEKDEGEAEALQKLGFEAVKWEDRGAHGTIFDDFDTPENETQSWIIEFQEFINSWVTIESTQFPYDFPPIITTDCPRRP